MGKFCVAMDNYFTLPHCIKHLNNNGVGVVEKAKMKKGWRTPGLCNIQEKHYDFNDFRYLINENGTLVAQ
eukprot:10175682-Ditylum_brightwellii.AAC.2